MPTSRLRATLSLLAAVCLSVPAVRAADWRPLDPAHLALKAPALDKDADAEVLFWDVRIEDFIRGQDLQAVFTHYVRMKVFTEKGAKEHATVDLPSYQKTRIGDLAGRTIKPDGSIVELKKDAVFERTVAKGDGFKARVRSFALPAVEPGSIIEYRYREFRDGEVSNHARLHFQRSVPTHLVTYHVKPLQLEWLPYAMRSYAFHCQHTPFQREPDGFYAISLQNVPAFRAEPYMPPEDQVRPWVILYYAEDKKLAPDKFWKETGRDLHRQFRDAAKVNDEIRRLATETVSGLATEEDKLAKLASVARAKVKNVYSELSGVTADQRRQFKPNRTAADALKQGLGTGLDINYLFAALATAIGLDPRLSATVDRSDIFFDANFLDDYFLRNYGIAIKTGDSWRFYDPATPYVPRNMLDWRMEGQQALVSDPKEPTFVPTPLSPPEFSRRLRTAKLTLDEAGTLSGTISVSYTGHEGVLQKHLYDEDSDAARLEAIRERLQESFGAEVSDVQVHNATDPINPFLYRATVRIPGYAQRTGKRLFIQPAFFQRGLSARFPASTRTHEVYFRYAWAEEDSVDIELPEGFELDNASAPRSFPIANVGNYAVKLSVSANPETRRKSLLYRRSFAFGKGGALFFPVNTYADIKKVFDNVHESDSHQVAIKLTQADAPTGK